MKMMEGAFSLARAKQSRTSLAPSPMNIWTSWGPASLRKVAFVWAAQARARRVLPVPGGPYIRAPGGGKGVVSVWQRWRRGGEEKGKG